MTGKAKEETRIHTRLLKITLALPETRAYWQRSAALDGAVTTTRAFEEHWFGARSESFVSVLLSTMRARYDVFPTALGALQRWTGMSAEARRVISHWHVQLTDPLYRSFTGRYLVERRDSGLDHIERAGVLAWVEDFQPGRWATTTRIQWASKLLSAANEAGLVQGIRDPRPLSTPTVPDEALEYLLYLLRDIEIEGRLLDNLYLASLGLSGVALRRRLHRLPGLELRIQGQLADFGWQSASLMEWVEAVI